jgi:hypothetical protein
MAKKEDRSGEVTGAGGATTQDTTQLKIRWDSSNMQRVCQRIQRSRYTRGGRSLFGMNQSWDASQREVTVQLSDRIVLSPFVAKRLSLVLSNVIRDYEARYGKLDVEARQPTDAPIS